MPPPDTVIAPPIGLDSSHTATCGRCREMVYFVAGVIGPERWRHVATNQAACDPRCKHCGAPGEIQVGSHDMDGGQVPVFRHSHWECGTCARRTLRIQHT